MRRKARLADGAIHHAPLAGPTAVLGALRPSCLATLAISRLCRGQAGTGLTNSLALGFFVKSPHAHWRRLPHVWAWT